MSKCKNKVKIKTKAQRERRKRWLRRRPDHVIKRLVCWYNKEKDPIKKAEAEKILKRFIAREKK